MELVVSRMSIDKEFAFRDLANSHIDDLGEGVDGIFRTNVMDVSIGDFDAKFKMVTKTISRVNHSYRPNMLYIFDLPTFSLHLHAVRPIASGEELTISYVPPLTTSSERASLLQSRYAIPPCTLPCCTSSITDTFRTSLQTKSTDLQNRLTTLQTRIKRTIQTVLVTGSKNPNTPDELANIRKVYKNAQALIREMKKYGLEACEEYARVVYTAAWCIFALSLDPRDGLRMTDAKVKKFRVWAVRVLRVHFGEEGEIYKSLVDQNRMFGIV
ncbi:hypothetical protein BDQ17DRAFT_1436781 [Cyathus striatus]|nr:hypothetical protein BDQ17DRAFT_1436781 [Cyathus striatus]